MRITIIWKRGALELKRDAIHALFDMRQLVAAAAPPDDWTELCVVVNRVASSSEAIARRK